MSVTAEEVRRRLRQAASAPSAEAVRERLAAAERASRVGTETGGSPAPDERGWMERIRSGAAALAEPWVETLEGYTELTGAPPETLGAVRRGREAIAEEAAKSPGRTAGRVVGEVAMMGIPASRAYRAGQMARGLPGVRSRMTQAAAPLAAETATVAGMEAVKSPEATGVPRAEAARDVALWNVGGAGLQRAMRALPLPGAFRRTPVAEAEAQALREAGIEPRIPLSAKGVEGTGPFSKFASWMHRRPLGSVPPTQSVIRGQQEAALSDWRELMFKQAVPERARIAGPGSRPDSLEPVYDTFEDINKWYRDEYKEVLDPYNFPVQSERGEVGNAINQAVQSVPGEGARRIVQEQVGTITADLSDSLGRISGSNISRLKTLLRKQASRPDQDPLVSQGYRDVIEAVDDSVESYVLKRNPEHAARLADLREPYRNLTVLREAAKGRKGGEFDPKDVRMASERKMTQEKRPGARSAGMGPLQREAVRAERTYDFPTGGEESNVFQFQALGGSLASIAPGIGGATAGGLLAPVGAAVTGALLTPTMAGLSRAGTRFMSNEAWWQRYLQDFLQHPGTRELGRAARIGGAQAATE